MVGSRGALSSVLEFEIPVCETFALEYAFEHARKLYQILLIQIALERSQRVLESPSIDKYFDVRSFEATVKVRCCTLECRLARDRSRYLDFARTIFAIY